VTFPTNFIDPLVTIHPFSLESLGFGITQMGAVNINTSAISGTFPAANRAIFYPFSVFKLIQVQNFFCINGSAVSGNFDIGVYDSAGTKIMSTGSTAQAGTTAIQAVSIAATNLPPGQYYMALAADNTTAAFYRMAVGATRYDQFYGLAQMATAFPLPATATFATIASDYIPLFGLSTRSVV
jgi:hypothetical protein